MLKLPKLKTSKNFVFTSVSLILSAMRKDKKY